MSSTQKKHSKAKGVLIALLILAVCAAGVIIYIRMHPKKKEAEPIPTVSLDKAKVGDIVTFGTYESDNNTENGEEPIYWDVMAEEDGKLLLATHFGIDCLQYNHYPQDITWEQCTLREWLNHDFYEKQFTDEEREHIQLSHLVNLDNTRWGTDGGADTDDRIFLFSVAELTALDGKATDEADPSRELSPTPYAVERHAWYSGLEGFEDNCIFWWTRSPGPSPNSVSCVMGDGVIMDGDQACYVSHDHYAIRPVMWITR